MNASILIVEDEPSMRLALEREFVGADWLTATVETASQARERLTVGGFSVVLCDVQLPDGDGLELLKTFSPKPGAPAFFMMSAFGTVARAVEAVKSGAVDFFEKPIAIPSVLEMLEAYRIPKAVRNSVGVEGINAPTQNFSTLCAPDSPLQETLRMAAILARKNCSVHLFGESGTGKEVIARILHDSGPRGSFPFIAVNCAAISPQLIEGELFGYRKGAFTGALTDRKGKIEEAQGGTLFLDEVGDMPLHVQSKLLRVLQEKAVCRIGDHREIPVDFRVVSATHKNLRQEADAGRFRSDLFYRLNVVEMRLPPLRERTMDIPWLARQFLATQLSKIDTDSAVATMPSSLLNHGFPGNVRELRNVVERYCVLRELGQSWSEALLDGSHLAESGGNAIGKTIANKQRISIRNTIRTDDQVLAALEQSGYNRRLASEILGISRRALQYRLARMQKA